MVDAAALNTAVPFLGTDEDIELHTMTHPMTPKLRSYLDASIRIIEQRRVRDNELANKRRRITFGNRSIIDIDLGEHTLMQKFDEWAATSSLCVGDMVTHVDGNKVDLAAPIEEDFSRPHCRLRVVRVQPRIKLQNYLESIRMMKEDNLSRLLKRQETMNPLQSVHRSQVDGRNLVILCNGQRIRQIEVSHVFANKFGFCIDESVNIIGIEEEQRQSGLLEGEHILQINGQNTTTMASFGVVAKNAAKLILLCSSLTCFAGNSYLCTCA